MIIAVTYTKTTEYRGTREALIAAGIATSDQFPSGAQHRIAKFRGHEPGTACDGLLEWTAYRTESGFVVMYSHSYLGIDLYAERVQVFSDYGLRT